MKSFPEIQDMPIEQIYEWMERGVAAKTIPEDVVNYLEAMKMVWSMTQRFDKWSDRLQIVDYLVRVEGYARTTANRLFQNTQEFYFVDQQASREALLGKLYHLSEKNLHFAIIMSKDTSDAAKVQKMIADMVDLVDKMCPEPEGFDDELFRRPIKLYTMTPEEAGLPSVSRKELVEMVDQYPQISELVKNKIKQEAGALPMEVFLEPEQDPREK